MVLTIAPDSSMNACKAGPSGTDTDIHGADKGIGYGHFTDPNIADLTGSPIHPPEPTVAVADNFDRIPPPPYRPGKSGFFGRWSTFWACTGNVKIIARPKNITVRISFITFSLFSKERKGYGEIDDPNVDIEPDHPDEREIIAILSKEITVK